MGWTQTDADAASLQYILVIDDVEVGYLELVTCNEGECWSCLPPQAAGIRQIQLIAERLGQRSERSAPLLYLEQR